MRPLLPTLLLLHAVLLFPSPVHADSATPGGTPEPETSSPDPTAASTEPEPQPERSRNRAPHIELGLLGSVAGATSGILMCAAAQCRGARAWVGSALLGAGVAGAAVGLSVRRRGIESATAQAIEGGAGFGGLSVVYLVLAMDGVNEDAFFGGIVGGELIGAGLGAAIERLVRPTSGSVALANGGGLWLPFVVLLPQTTTGSDGEDGLSRSRTRLMGSSLLVAQMAGLGLGGYLGRLDRVERWQVWLADAGGLIGAGLAPMLGWLVAGDDVSATALTVASSLGAAAGFVSGYLLATRIPARRGRSARGRGPSPDVKLGVAPAQGGGTLSLSARW